MGWANHHDDHPTAAEQARRLEEYDRRMHAKAAEEWDRRQELYQEQQRLKAAH